VVISTVTVDEAGFAILPDVFSAGRMDQLLADLSQNSLLRSRAGIRHAMKLPSVADIARNDLLELAKTVLGREAVPFRAALFDKSAASNWLVVWHQDTALPIAKRKDVQGWGPWSTKEGVCYAHAPAHALCQVLALRVHLDDSTATNGPLRVRPGTHAHGVLTDDEIHALAESIHPVECTTSRGGVVAMRPLLVHASSKSQDHVPRRVLHIEYAAAPVLDGLTLAVV
jgi:ectoine hydroxylase-related dioxygenase (phytanoyl-CoA dioxygenase family)